MEHIAAVIWAVLLRLTFRDATSPLPPTEVPAFQPQTNAHDCGVYVCFLLNALCLSGGPVDFSAVCTPDAVRAYRGHMNVTLSRMREEYEQLRGKSVVGKPIDPTTIRPGAADAARGPRADDLEEVKGDMEDDIEAEIRAAKEARIAKRLAAAAAKAAEAAASGGGGSGGGSAGGGIGKR